VQVILGYKEDLVQVLLSNLNVIVVEFEHHYVLAFDFKCPLQVYYSRCVDELLAFDWVACVILQKFLAIFYVFIVDHSVRFDSFEIIVSNSFEVKTE